MTEKPRRLSVADIAPLPTSHGCGHKRILLGKDDTQTALTQIAVTTMSPGEESGTHLHPTMEECFLIRKGKLRIDFGSESITASEDDFIHIPAGTKHNVMALTEAEMLTIGCAVARQQI